jgi:hypothetical protein
VIEPPPGQIALPDADIYAAEIAPLHPNVDVAVVNGNQEVEEGNPPATPLIPGKSWRPAAHAC